MAKSSTSLCSFGQPQMRRSGRIGFWRFPFNSCVAMVARNSEVAVSVLSAPGAQSARGPAPALLGQILRSSLDGTPLGNWRSKGLTCYRRQSD